MTEAEVAMKSLSHVASFELAGSRAVKGSPADREGPRMPHCCSYGSTFWVANAFSSDGGGGGITVYDSHTGKCVHVISSVQAAPARLASNTSATRPLVVTALVAVGNTVWAGTLDGWVHVFHAEAPFAPVSSNRVFGPTDVGARTGAGKAQEAPPGCGAAASEVSVMVCYSPSGSGATCVGADAALRVIFGSGDSRVVEMDAATAKITACYGKTARGAAASRAARVTAMAVFGALLFVGDEGGVVYVYTVAAATAGRESGVRRVPSQTSCCRIFMQQSGSGAGPHGSPLPHTSFEASPAGAAPRLVPTALHVDAGSTTLWVGTAEGTLCFYPLSDAVLAGGSPKSVPRVFSLPSSPVQSSTTLPAAGPCVVSLTPLCGKVLVTTALEDRVFVMDGGTQQLLETVVLEAPSGAPSPNRAGITAVKLFVSETARVLFFNPNAAPSHLYDADGFFVPLHEAFPHPTATGPLVGVAEVPRTCPRGLVCPPSVPGSCRVSLDPLLTVERAALDVELAKALDEVEACRAEIRQLQRTNQEYMLRSTVADERLLVKSVELTELEARHKVSKDDITPLREKIAALSSSEVALKQEKRVLEEQLQHSREEAAYQRSQLALETAAKLEKSNQVAQLTAENQLLTLRLEEADRKRLHLETLLERLTGEPFSVLRDSGLCAQGQGVVSYQASVDGLQAKYDAVAAEASAATAKASQLEHTLAVQHIQMRDLMALLKGLKGKAMEVVSDDALFALLHVLLVRHPAMLSVSEETLARDEKLGAALPEPSLKAYLSKLKQESAEMYESFMAAFLDPEERKKWVACQSCDGGKVESVAAAPAAPLAPPSAAAPANANSLGSLSSPALLTRPPGIGLPLWSSAAPPPSAPPADTLCRSGSVEVATSILDRLRVGSPNARLPLQTEPATFGEATGEKAAPTVAAAATPGATSLLLSAAALPAAAETTAGKFDLPAQVVGRLEANAVASPIVAKVPAPGVVHADGTAAPTLCTDRTYREERLLLQFIIDTRKELVFRLAVIGEAARTVYAAVAALCGDDELAPAPATARAPAESRRRVAGDGGVGTVSLKALFRNERAALHAAARLLANCRSIHKELFTELEKQQYAFYVD